MMFSRSQWIFALKVYLAVMLSFLLGSRMGISQNYWSMLTCCVLMNPSSGAMWARSGYRMAGTILGGIAALILASLLANTPQLLLGALGIVSAAGFSLALLDRTPRNYGYRIFSMTLMVVAIPSVGHPLTIFDTTVARVFEIAVAVVCTTLVDGLIAPSSMEPVILGKVDKWLLNMDRWAQDAFSGKIRDEKTSHDRLMALADISSTSLLAGQLRYDHVLDRNQRGSVYAIQHRLMALVPLLSGIAHGLGDLPSDIRRPMGKTLSGMLDSGDAFTLPDITRALDSPELEAACGVWGRLTRDNVAGLARKALTLHREIRLLRRSMEKGGQLPETLLEEVRNIRSFPLRADGYMAVRIFWGFSLTYAVLCLLWWLTGWVQMPRAILLAAVTAGFFGPAERAGIAIKKLGRTMLTLMVTTGLFCFCLLPLTRDFLSFAVVMALFILPFGAWSAKNIMGRLVLSLGVSTMNLGNGFVSMGFNTFIESFAANYFGVLVAFFSLAFVRSMATDFTLNRLLAKGRHDVLGMARGEVAPDPVKYLHRGINRISLFALRLAPARETHRSDRIMEVLLAGISIAELQRCCTLYNEDILETCEALFDSLGRELFVKERSWDLLLTIDRAISSAWNHNIRCVELEVLGSLVRLRQALFDGASAWRPQS